eukprot:m.260803 g.260803  ORF g.260803 m.260803 type:complete len:1075 (+) comp16214_c0_seq13:187-3411(+)
MEENNSTIVIQFPPFNAGIGGPAIRVEVPQDERPLTLWVHELHNTDIFKKSLESLSLGNKGKECKAIGLLYPPFDLGIKIPSETPCSVLACMNTIGADVVFTENQGPHVAARQLSKFASQDDEKAYQIDMEARKAAKLLVGPKGLILRHELRKLFEKVSLREFQATLTYLPYKPLLNAFKGGAKEEPWFHALTQEQLNQALLRTDWRRRQQFLHQDTPPEHIIPVYNKLGELQPEVAKSRKLSSDELNHPIYDAKVKFPEVINNIHDFKDRFDASTEEFLKDVLGTDKNGAQVFCAGGTVLGCMSMFANQKSEEEKSDEYMTRWNLLQALLLIDCIPGLPQELLDKIKSFMPIPDESNNAESIFGGWDSPYSGGDIDVFVAAKSLEDGKEAVRRTVQQIRQNLTEELAQDETSYPLSEDVEEEENYNVHIRMMRTANAISIWCPESGQIVQVIMICYKNMEEVLQFFDLDCVCVAYDGSNVFALPRAVRALQTGYNFVEPAKLRRWSTGPRIVKYSLRGFGTVFSEICRHHPRCDLKSTLTEEMALKISSLNASTDADVDFGYNTAALGDVVLEMGSHLDKHMQKMEETVNALKQNRIFEGDERKKPPVEASLMSKFHFFYGWKSIGNANIDKAINGLKGIPPMRFKSADLWESVRGNEFLPKCYMCRARIDPVETLSERPRVCDACEFLNSSKRTQSADLSNTVAVVTGGRCRIGYATAIRLLRLGATVIVTSRFPNTTARKYALEKDWSVWKDKLFIYGLDFRHMPSVAQFTASVASQHPQINLLINNAAQTIRRPLSYTSILAKENAQPLSDEAASRIVWQSNFGALDGHHLEDGKVFSLLSLENAESRPEIDEKDDGSAQKVKAKAAVQVKAKAAVKKKVVAKKKTTDADEIARDKDGEPIDTRKTTTWNTPSLGVDPLEYLEVQFINVHAPWQIIQNLRPCLNAAGKDGKALIVNVTSAEGIFNTGGFDETQPSSKKHHAHTNMAKAALNMLTYSLASELSQTNVSVLSVDTGWVSQMVPDSRAHITSDPPLTCEDGAARVLDPFIQWAQGVYPPSGKLLRHFQIAKKW